MDAALTAAGISIDRALLKLDLQGWEAAALRGAPETLSKCLVVEVEVPLGRGIYAETESTRDEVFAILHRSGFAPVSFHTERWFNGNPPDMDVLFRRT